MTRLKTPWIAALAVACLAATAPVAPTAPANRVAPPVSNSRSAGAMHVNPHLHVAAATAVVPARSYRWRHVLVTSAWIGLHRGHGTIQGVVRNGEGSPMSGASVRLRDRHGHTLRSASARHITSTGAGGLFTMFGVRPGRYHVRADAGKHNGHTSIHLHPGAMLDVTVKV